MRNDDSTTPDSASVTIEQLSNFSPAAIRQPLASGEDYLKALDMSEFITKHECYNLLLDHPWISKLKLVSNRYMYRTFAKSDYKTGTIHLSEKLFKEPDATQREVFIRAVCHFIAKQVFDEAGNGAPYRWLVAKYVKKAKGQSNSTGAIQERELETVE